MSNTPQAYQVVFRVSGRLPIPSLKGQEGVRAVLTRGELIDCTPDIVEAEPNSKKRDYTLVFQPGTDGAADELRTQLIGDSELDKVRVDPLVLEATRLRPRGDIPVNAERLNELETQASEVFGAVSRLGSILDRASARDEDDFNGRWEDIQRARQLQESLLPSVQRLREATRNIRLVPAAQLLARMHRAVRDLARENGKDVDFIVEGKEIELDQNVLETMREPLLHLVRNSVGHGIEPPEEREAAGKPAKGSIKVQVYLAGDNCVFEVIDDGRGLDREKIGARAARASLVTRPELEQMSDSQVFSFIYAPGVTTADQLSTLSGRGIGMDIVRNAIVKLGGTIETAGQPGDGARFTMRVPVSASLIRALVVEAAGRRVAIPTSSIRSIGTAEDWREGHHGATVPLISLASALGWGDPPASKVVEVGVAERRIGLAVESCLHNEELALRPLGEFLGQIPVIRGAALLSDGHPILILNAGELVNQLRI